MNSLATTIILLSLHTLFIHALQLASLGSSFAAGPGLSVNYASILSRKIGAQHTDLSRSGTTLLDLPGQISRISRTTEIVTLTSGGNDLGYMAGLISESLGIRAFGSGVTGEQLLGRFNDMLGKVHTQAPNATVYLAEYLTILGTEVKPGVDVSFNAARVQYFKGVAATLLDATKKAAQGKTWVRLVPVAEASMSHGVGASVPWVNSAGGSLSDGIAWHPNSKGMNAVAEMIYDIIKKGPGRKRNIRIEKHY